MLCFASVHRIRLQILNVILLFVLVDTLSLIIPHMLAPRPSKFSLQGTTCIGCGLSQHYDNSRNARRKTGFFVFRGTDTQCTRIFFSSASTETELSWSRAGVANYDEYSNADREIRVSVKHAVAVAYLGGQNSMWFF